MRTAGEASHWGPVVLAPGGQCGAGPGAPRQDPGIFGPWAPAEVTLSSRLYSWRDASCKVAEEEVSNLPIPGDKEVLLHAKGELGRGGGGVSSWSTLDGPLLLRISQSVLKLWIEALS